MTELSFEHIGSTEFEKFCYKLLNEMGFENLNWRKGTGKDASPADSGRDIEATRFRKDIDGEVVKEEWFVDPKCYKKGVPPNSIDGSLAWAQAESPDVLLIIASNFLSNPCKEFLEKFKENNSPSFTIKFWENPDLAELTLDKQELLSDFGLTREFIDPEYLHPSHLRF